MRKFIIKAVCLVLGLFISLNAITHPNNYYAFLEEINYAEEKSYTRLLKEIVKNRKDDKRGHTEGDSFA